MNELHEREREALERGEPRPRALAMARRVVSDLGGHRPSKEQLPAGLEGGDVAAPPAVRAAHAEELLKPRLRLPGRQTVLSQPLRRCERCPELVERADQGRFAEKRGAYVDELGRSLLDEV